MAKSWKNRVLARLVALLLLVASLATLSLTLVYQALSPKLAAERAMTDWASRYAKLTDIRDFAIFNGQETYYSIRGQDDLGQDMVLLTEDFAQQPRLIALSEGLTKEAILALAKEQGLAPETASLGLYDQTLVWEVSSQDQYYLFDFKTGDLLRVLG